MAVTLSRQGQANSAGAVTANFLRVFSGEVLAAFNGATVVAPYALTKNIKSGKSAMFPATGLSTVSYHTAGAELTGDAINNSAVTISIDGQLVANTFIDDLDDAMADYDARSVYATNMGSEIAGLLDEHVIIEGLKGAAASATVTGLPGGTELTDANFGSATASTKAQALYDGLFESQAKLDDNKAPQTGRFFVTTPTNYAALIQVAQSSGFSAINKDFGGKGDVAQGIIYELAGFTILKSPWTPFGSNRAASGNYTYHAFDASNYVGLCGCSNSVGVVKLMDLAMKQEYRLEYLAQMIVASMAAGVGFLRPECLVSFKTS